MKVTNKGEMVTPMESSHRRPYEPLILGYCGDTIPPKFSEIVENQVIISVPGKHSRKPFLTSTNTNKNHISNK